MLIDFYLCSRINVVNDNYNHEEQFNEINLNLATPPAQSTSNLSNSSSQQIFVSKRLNFLLIICSIFGISFYVIYACLCASKQDCEDVHAFLTIIPVS